MQLARTRGADRPSVVVDDVRGRTVEEHVAVAEKQIAEAADDPTRLRSVLIYWFSVLFDEGKQEARALPDTVNRLREMNRRLEERLRESGLPPAPGESGEEPRDS